MPRFFRDEAGLVALAKALAQAPPDAGAGDAYRIWVTSGSIGEDAYSAAIALSSALKRPIKVFATSRDAHAVRRARVGHYDGAISRQISRGRLSGFFHKTTGGYQVGGGLRRRCVFAVHDLAEDFPFVRLDAIVCPVAMSRWTEEARRRALGLFFYALKPGGLLLLSSSASGEELERFERLGRSTALFRRPPARFASRELQLLLSRAAATLSERTEASSLSSDSRQRQDEFVAMVSHELRTPLASILGYLETLKAGVKDPAKNREFLGVIERNAKRLMTTVESLVGVADARSGRRNSEPIDVSKAARAAASMVRAAARKAGVTVAVSVDGDLRALADPADVPHILENLLGNAIKYNRRGGRVDVTCAREKDAVVVSVADTGIGIPEEAQARVFDRFFRGVHGRRLKVTGLGLSIVRGLVEANGGRVSVRSVEGEGSTFRVSLPPA